MTARTVIDHALTALNSVTAPTEVARAMRATADELDRAWQRSPLTAGLAGNLVARSELVNLLVGEHVLDPFRRALGSAPLRIRRGDTLHYRAVRFDGSVVEKSAPVPEPRDDEAELDLRASSVRAELATRETALVTVERSVPALVRRRPAAWAVWLWPVRWLLGVIHRKAIAAWRATRTRVGETERELATIERCVAVRDERERAAREAYYGELRLLCGGGESGKDVRAIELAVPGVPEGVELVELMGALRASADVDAVIVVERDALYAPRPDGSQVALGPAAETLAELPALLSRARALTLARRARDKLGTARAAVEAELDRSEQQFDDRLGQITKLALPIDTASFAAAQLARVRPTIAASVNAVMEHASTHLGSELQQLADAWIAAVDGAPGSDALKAAVARIEEEWPAAAKRIADEVRVLVIGGAGGVARDLYSETVSALRAHGLGEEHTRTPRRAPEVPPVQILPSLAEPTAFSLGTSWFSSLFKSIDARKTDLHDKVSARATHIREVAAAEMLDAEPKLHAAVAQALAAQLDTAIELQQSWHQQAIADVHAAITKDREALAPVIANRDALASAAVRLGEVTAALEAEQPAVAAAAVAAAS